MQRNAAGVLVKGDFTKTVSLFPHLRKRQARYEKREPKECYELFQSNKVDFNLYKGGDFVYEIVGIKIEHRLIGFNDAAD